MTKELARWRHRIDLGDVIQSPRGEYMLWEDYDKLAKDFAALQSQWDDMQQGLLEVFGEPVQDAIELLGATEQLRSAAEPPEQQPMPFKEWVADIRTQSMQKTIQAYKAKIRQLEYQLACCPSEKSSPADLVGALQDVVHTDPGPVRAGHAVKRPSDPPATSRYCVVCNRIKDDSGETYGWGLCHCGSFRQPALKSAEVPTRVTVCCSQCTATVSLPQRDGMVDIAALGLWYFSTPTGWRCPAHAPRTGAVE